MAGAAVSGEFNRKGSQRGPVRHIERLDARLHRVRLETLFGPVFHQKPLFLDYFEWSGTRAGSGRVGRPDRVRRDRRGFAVLRECSETKPGPAGAG